MLQQLRTLQAGSRHHVAFQPARPAAARRTRCVQVLAKKGKGRGLLRQSAGVSGQPGIMMQPGGQAMSMTSGGMVAPAVDPENAEFVVFIKARNFKDSTGVMIKEGPWMPLSIFKGGQAANFLVKAMESHWGRSLYANQLIRNIGINLYKERGTIESAVRKQFPPYKDVSSKSFSFAFKIRDKSLPESWKDATNVTELPAEAELQPTGLDSLKAFFSTDNLSTLFAQKAT